MSLCADDAARSPRTVIILSRSHKGEAMRIQIPRASAGPVIGARRHTREWKEGEWATEALLMPCACRGQAKTMDPLAC